VLTTAVRRADGRGSNTNARLFMATRKSPRPMVPGSAAAELVPELGVAESDIVLPRMHGVSPMNGTGLDPVLRNLGVRTIVAAGVSVNVAIMNLVLDAVNAGYQVVVPRDAVAGLPAAYVDAVFEHTLGLLATVSTAADVLAVWQP
jgi:nicotinamidase-related amidase